MRQDTYFKYIQNVSLRGSLAINFRQIASSSSKEAENYVFHLATGNDPNILRISCVDEIIIGRKDEQGMFRPDW